MFVFIFTCISINDIESEIPDKISTKTNFRKESIKETAHRMAYLNGSSILLVVLGFQLNVMVFESSYLFNRDMLYLVVFY